MVSLKLCQAYTLSKTLFMHLFRRLLTAIFLTVISVILLFSAVGAYLIVTPLGGKLLVRYFKEQFVSVGLMHVGHYEGNLHNGFILKDVSIKGLAYLPNALLRIQEIHVRLPLWDPLHSDIDIFNARILMTDSDPLVFTGRIYAGQIKGNLYGKSVDIHEVSRFWSSEDIRKNLQGFVTDIDLNIQGPLASPMVNGSFIAESIRYRSIVLTNGASRVYLIVVPVMGQLQIKGAVIVDSGLVNIRDTNLQLQKSKFIFEDEILNPRMDIRLGAKVEDMDFHLSVEGPLASAHLIVSSDPPMAPQDALNILFTGNAWSASTSPFNGVTSSELAENFLDYSLQNINEQQQFGLKTKLTDNLKLGVEMDQIPAPPGETNVYYSRKINGEMDMTDHTSLNISQEVMPQQRDPSQSALDTQTASETQIYVQYKKRF